MTKVVVSSSLVTSAAALGIAFLDKIFTARFGSEAGSVVNLIGQAAEQALTTIVKPNSADQDGLPLKVTTDGVTTKTDAAIETGAALATEVGEAALGNTGVVHGAA